MRLRGRRRPERCESQGCEGFGDWAAARLEGGAAGVRDARLGRAFEARYPAQARIR